MPLQNSVGTVALTEISYVVITIVMLIFSCMNVFVLFSSFRNYVSVQLSAILGSPALGAECTGYKGGVCFELLLYFIVTP